MTKAPAVPNGTAQTEPEYVEVQNEAEQTEKDFGTWAQEDILRANQAIANMSPEEFLAMEVIIGDSDSELPEAGGIAFCQLYSESGLQINITQRGIDAIAAVDGLSKAVAHAKSKYNLASHTHPSSGRAPAQKKPTNSAPSTTSAPTPPSEPEQQAPREGTNKLNKLIVTSSYVEFHVEGLKYPLKDSRVKLENGPSIIAAMFDDDLGWEDGHFARAAEYTQADFGNLFLDWKQEGKYYNVKRIHE